MGLISRVSSRTYRSSKFQNVWEERSTVTMKSNPQKYPTRPSIPVKIYSRVLSPPPVGLLSPPPPISQPLFKSSVFLVPFSPDTDNFQQPPLLQKPPPPPVQSHTNPEIQAVSNIDNNNQITFPTLLPPKIPTKPKPKMDV